jgi:hypothetical protein
MTRNEAPIHSVRLMRELRDALDGRMAEMTPEQRVAFIDHDAERLARDWGLPAAVDPRVAAERARSARRASPRAA